MGLPEWVDHLSYGNGNNNLGFGYGRESNDNNGILLIGYIPIEYKYKWMNINE